MSATGGERRKVDANYNDVPQFQMVQLGILGQESPDFGHRDPESLSICPLLTPSPTGIDYHNDPLSAALEQKMLLEGKSPSPDFAHDEETALLANSPSASYTHPLDPLRNEYLGFERQNTPSSVDTEMTGISSHPSRGVSGVPYSELEMSNTENASGRDFPNRGRNSLPSEVLESSASSSSVALHENIASTQLLGNHYKSLENSCKKMNNVATFIAQEKCIKKPTLDPVDLELTPDYSFLAWSWPLIRKSCFWTIVSAMIACVCVVVAMLATVPRRCLPSHSWYQGTVFYEIFPASFQDSGRDGIGDLRGIASRADYLYSLGVKAIRLNSIFPANHYPENYDKVTNLTDIEKTLGDFKDFHFMLKVLKERNISVILDFPIHPYVKDIGEMKVSVTRKKVADKITNVMHNHRSHRSVLDDCLHKSEFGGAKYLKPYIDGGIAGLMKSTSDHLNSISQSIVEEAIEFWFGHGVDGVYLKGLEYYVNDDKFIHELKKWRRIKESFREKGEDKILMCDYRLLSLANEETAATILSTMDLLDVFLDVANGTRHIKQEVCKHQQSRLFVKRDYPWIHWNIGNVDTKRLASRVENNLGAILFQFLLPGTVSIFYGDEIGLTEIHDPHFDHTDVKYVHHLAPMKWHPNGTGFTRSDTLPWLPFAKTVRTNNVHEKILYNMTALREDAPSIYMNSIWKDEESLSNFAFRYIDENIVVLERSYPRRNAYVVVFNAGGDEARNDLSSIYYGGELVEDSRGRSGDYVNFNLLRLGSGEACVIKLDK